MYLSELIPKSRKGMMTIRLEYFEEHDHETRTNLELFEWREERREEEKHTQQNQMTTEKVKYFVVDQFANLLPSNFTRLIYRGKAAESQRAGPEKEDSLRIIKDSGWWQ